MTEGTADCIVDLEGLGLGRGKAYFTSLPYLIVYKVVS